MLAIRWTPLLVSFLFAGTCLAAEPVLRTASTHPLRYYAVESNREPDRGRRLPVIVCLTGVDADFRGAALRFAEARGDSPILVVVPCTFSSANAMRGQVAQRYTELYGESLVEQVGGTGVIPEVRSRLAWDEEGLLAILRDLGRDRPVEERVFLTGFSGGGLLTWWMTLRHPNLLAGVIPVCPNHAFWAVGQRDANPGERSAPIRVISGERDTLRQSRIGLPMPPVLLTLMFALALGPVAGLVVWRCWRRARWVVATEFLVTIVAIALAVGRMSGNDFQSAVAVDLVRRLGHQVEWAVQPGMWHDPAPAKVLEAITRWRGGEISGRVGVVTLCLRSL